MITIVITVILKITIITTKKPISTTITTILKRDL